MRPCDCLLQFIALSDEPLNPVRLQYGMFYAEMSGLWEEAAYSFIAFDYGPMSERIYRDVRTLVENDKIHEIVQVGMSWSLYRAAPATLTPPRSDTRRDDCLSAIRTEVASSSMAGLFRGLRERFPDYASRLLFTS